MEDGSRTVNRAIINFLMTVYGESVSDVATILCAEADWNLTTIKRIENGYQCCVRKYPALNPHAFKRFVNYRAPEISKKLDVTLN